MWRLFTVLLSVFWFLPWDNPLLTVLPPDLLEPFISLSLPSCPRPNSAELFSLWSLLPGLGLCISCCLCPAVGLLRLMLLWGDAVRLQEQPTFFKLFYHLYFCRNQIICHADVFLCVCKSKAGLKLCRAKKYFLQEESACGTGSSYWGACHRYRPRGDDAY